MRRLTVFAVLIGLKVEITGKILKKRLIFSENIIGMIDCSIAFLKIEVCKYFFLSYSVSPLSYETVHYPC